MYGNLLLPVALDHGDDVNALLEIATRLGRDGAKITVMTVLEPAPVYVSASLPEDYLETQSAKLRKDIESAIGGREGIDVLVKTGHPSECILTHAESDGVDCIVMEAKNTLVSKFLLGSIAQRIARRASCSVHICR